MFSFFFQTAYYPVGHECLHLMEYPIDIVWKYGITLGVKTCILKVPSLITRLAGSIPRSQDRYYRFETNLIP